MRRCVLALVLAGTLALGGCGSGADSSTGADGGSQRYFRDFPGQEATALRISGSDCRKLAAAVAAQTGRRVRDESEPTPPNSRCQITGRGVHVSITLDAAHGARQRYSNRMAEQVQFNAADPTKVPHAVPGVGDRAAYDHYASWIPAYSTLYAVRGNRWLTLVYSVDGRIRPQRLAAAAALARRAFVFTAD
jgi:hypothetical protein